MVEVSNIVKYQDSITGAEVSLSIDIIKREICPKATDMEAAQFLRLCQYQGLNPFVKDAYLIKYGDSPATLVTGKDAFMKRADAHPQFAGIESGVIVKKGEQLENRVGTLILKDEELVGGWARVARNDRKIDVAPTVSLSEFNNGRGLWKNMPGIMIEKCAIVTALRRAFPRTFAGLYDSAEMGVELNDDLEPIVAETQWSGERTVAPLEASVVEVEQAPAETPEPETTEDVVEAQVQEIINSTVDMIETAAATTTSGKPFCEKHSQAFGKGVNQGTGEQCWMHPYTVTVNNEQHQSWCISDAPVA